MTIDVGALLASLEGRRDVESYRVVAFDPSQAEDSVALEDLVRSGAVVRGHDTLDDQSRELALTRHPEVERPSAEEVERWVLELRAGRSRETYGRLVFYPWSGELVRVLPPAEFRELRADRNRYKIAPGESERLARATIGVVGLSVGHAAAVTMALEGVGGRFRLADFDALSLSNLNRIRSRTAMLGVNKAIVAAREMLELDPFLDIDVITDGITAENIERFLTEPPLDLLVEECDDLYAKLRLREHARALGIPVLMETSDRGMIDVERFDRDPERPIFHGLVGSLRAEDVAGLSTREKVPFVLRILGAEAISSRLAASLLEVKQSLFTWPQLGSSVALGGALVTDTARRILLGELEGSGRFHVDLDSIVTGARAPSEIAVDEPRARPPTALEPPPPRSSGRVTGEEVRWLVSAARLAPSAGNQQPWRFRFRRGRLELRSAPDHVWTFLDYRGLATDFALGAAMENIAIAATHLGFEAVVTGSRDDRVHYARFEPRDARTPDALLSAIPARVTERQREHRAPIAASVLERVAAEGSRGVGSLAIRSDRATIDAVAEIVARADRVAYLHPAMHRELMGEMRFSERDASARRDGIEVSELRLSPFEAAGLRLASRRDAIALVRDVGGGGGLGKLSREWFEAGSAVGIFSVGTFSDAFDGGRTMQRAWLEATAAGVGLHPITGLLYLGLRVRHGAEGLAPADAAEIGRLYDALLAAFGVGDDVIPLLLFRLTPRLSTPRHLRKELDEVLLFG